MTAHLRTTLEAAKNKLRRCAKYQTALIYTKLDSEVAEVERRLERKDAIQHGHGRSCNTSQGTAGRCAKRRNSSAGPATGRILKALVVEQSRQLDLRAHAITDANTALKQTIASFETTRGGRGQARA